MAEYILGVDGGNTKTHYALFTTQGQQVVFEEGGASSHYHFPDGYRGVKRELETHITRMLERAGCNLDDIGYGLFGLSGIDATSQHQAICEQIREIGITRFAVYNDAYLGIKAGSYRGYGICSINGTSTCCAAIDRHGHRLQIGGPSVIGDATGALRIGGLVLKRVYDAFFRGGPTTEMTALVFDALKITHEDELVDAIVARVNTKQVKKDSLATIAFQAATGGDRVAIDILSSAGVESARSVIGAARKLDFSHETSIDVVMAGAVYVKGDNPTLVETFQYEVSRHVEQPVNFILLSVPPVVGAVIWAIESLRGTVPEGVRAQIVQSMSDEKEHR